MRREGLEPPTVGLEIRCSIQLSYRRLWKIVFAEVWADNGEADWQGE